MSGARSALGLDGPAFVLRADGREHTDTTMRRDGDGWRDGEVAVRLRESREADGSWSLVLEAEGVTRVEEVCLLDHDVEPDADEIVDYAWFDDWGLQQSTAVFVRAGERSLFGCVGNPFGRAEVAGRHVRLWYRPGLEVDGAFVSDPFVVGPVRLEGRELRREALPGRDTVCGRESSYVRTLGRGAPVSLDAGEARAVRAAVAARVPWEPARMQVSHWDWGENLFRRDPAEQEVQAIYERAATLCAEIGVRTLLLCPGNLHAAWPNLLDEAREHGPHQHGMWFGMGIDVGLGRWRPGDEPEGLAEIVAAARTRGLGVAAYVNPTYLWLRKPEWQVIQQEHELLDAGYRMCCLAHAPARDYLIDRLREFVAAYDVDGVALDFVFWRPCHSTGHGHAPGEDSRYAQWDGLRQVVAALRELGLEWVEGLMASQEQMPWGSRGLTHPHPYMGDNQPQWQSAWPDLSLHRSIGNFQRRVGWWFRNFGFLPTYKVPGQVGHQANRLRSGDTERGWDWAGARYGLLSAIASAPSSLSVCFLPVCDEGEWAAMRERDGEFFARWIAFAAENAETLARLEDLFEEPRPGQVDGSVALRDDGRGFVFLANPDFEEHAVAVPRLPEGSALAELHPEEGRLWLPEEVVVEPHEVAVLRVLPRAEVALPALYGASGTAGEDGAVLSARGRPGAEARVAVEHAGGVQRRLLRFAPDGIAPTLGPWRAGGGAVDAATLAGDVRLETAWTPGRALPELLARLAPPFAAEGHELLQPWSDPGRLRLFLELLDPQAVAVRARVDGAEVEVAQAYVGTWEEIKDPGRLGLENNLLGHYLDLHERLLASDDLERPWRIELELRGLQPGAWRGVHVAELPRRTTSEFSL
ncbi:MAG TPA: hypothetical protein VFJ91_09220 [Gaiellaceae bacterium]|nr:hypothetical protein [Gaiellaceae bacterium]